MGCGSSKSNNVVQAQPIIQNEGAPSQEQNLMNPPKASSQMPIQNQEILNPAGNASGITGNIGNTGKKLSQPPQIQAQIDSRKFIEEGEVEFVPLPEDQRPTGDVLETPNILFYFDFGAKMFYYYSTFSHEWNSNDLTHSMDNCRRCPLLKFKNPGEEEEAIQHAKYMSFIATSDETIFIIGGYNTFYSCLEYNITQNSFLVKEPLKDYRNNPSLCKFGDNIFAISGDLLDSFSTDVNMYDIQKNEWTSLPDLPFPQGLAAARVVYDGSPQTNPVSGSRNLDHHYNQGLKLAVLGGLSEKLPKTYSSLLSLYSFQTERWQICDLTKMFAQKIPNFVNCSIIQRSEGDLIILGSEGTKNTYKFDFINMRLGTAGRLPLEENFNVSVKSKEILYRNNQIFCLSHKQDLRVYLGYLTLEKWEVVE